MTTYNPSSISVQDYPSVVKGTADSNNIANDRQQVRRTRRRGKPGKLDLLNPEVLRRFLDEGVPEPDVLYVAAETQRCVRHIEGGDDLPEQLHPWTTELLMRYGTDKVATLFFSTTGGRMVRV